MTRAQVPPAPDTTTAVTVLDVFEDNTRLFGGRPALRFCDPGNDGAWTALSWRAYGERVARAAAGLVALGVEPGDRVGILSSNRWEWHVADLAVLSAGAVSVPVYATSVSTQVAYVLGHAGARVCLVANLDQAAKVLLQRARLPELERVVLFDPADGLDDDFLLSFDDLLGLGDQRLASEPEVVSRRRRAIDPGGLATLVYTSGTTGPPKGAMLTHGNLVATIRSVTRVVPVGPDDRFLSFLPLSHIAERVVSHFGQVVSGGETWFARSLATVVDDLRACRPTVFFAVPRVWEKFQAGVVEEVARQPRFEQALFERFLALGRAKVDAWEDGRRFPMRPFASWLALDRVVGRAIRRKLGLDRARILVTSAAPIDADVLRWFHALGLRIVEVWGQTEDCGPATMNPPDRIELGTVGLPLPGLELRIAVDGEVMVRGETVCLGYFRDEERTRSLFDADGWMHTGDLGWVDPNGYLTITGRKKDLIITSSGKNIAPQELEVRLRAGALVSQAVVVGDRRPYLVALLTLDAEALREWAVARGKLFDIEALSQDPDVLAEVGAEVERVNEGRSPIERLKRWRVLPAEFTVAGGELTPTLKVKRDVVVQHYAAVVEELYADRPRVAPRHEGA